MSKIDFLENYQKNRKAHGAQVVPITINSGRYLFMIWQWMFPCTSNNHTKTVRDYLFDHIQFGKSALHLVFAHPCYSTSCQCHWQKDCTDKPIQISHTVIVQIPDFTGLERDSA